MKRAQPFASLFFSPALLTSLIVLSAAVIAHAAAPFDRATVTRLQNKVNYGERRGEGSVSRPAAVQDVVRANNFLVSESDSRAELQYPDGSLVRIGQNTVFTFDDDTRTLSLTKGTLIFHIPKGSGGGTIKTPSLTAAITGTTGKVSENLIAILEGEVTLQPSGRKVGAGEFARRNADGTITIAKFDPARAMDGALMNFNGPMPGFDEGLLASRPTLPTPPDFRDIEVLQRTQNLPSSIERFFPEIQEPPPVDRTEPRVVVPPPVNRPPVQRPGGGKTGGNNNGGGKY